MKLGLPTCVRSSQAFYSTVQSYLKVGRVSAPRMLSHHPLRRCYTLTPFKFDEDGMEADSCVDVKLMLHRTKNSELRGIN